MQNISYTDPLSSAWASMRRILFHPLDLGKWFALGFSAWLATLGENGGSLNLDSFEKHKESGALGEMLRSHLTAVVVISSIVIFLLILISIFLLWLRGRGKFMFLDNVLRDRTSISETWRRFRHEGNSYFLWMLVFGITAGFVFALLATAGTVLAWPDIQHRHFGKHAALSLAVTAPIFLLALVAVSFITSWMESFVVPLMYRYGFTARQAWSRFGVLLKARFWSVVLYSLFVGVLGMAFACALILAGCLTCCCGFMIVAIPYIGTVVLLPVFVFFRLYSVHFLRQFGPEWDADGRIAPPDIIEPSPAPDI